MSKVFSKEIIRKEVVGTDGSKIGTLINIIADLDSGALVDIVVKPDMGFDTTGCRMEGDHVLFPFDSVEDVGHYIMVVKSKS
jgi:sporulation protein YlmC with PRC-barrel domain